MLIEILDTNFTKLLTSAVKTPTDTETGEHSCFTPSDRQDQTRFAMLFDAMMNMLKLGAKLAQILRSIHTVWQVEATFSDA